MYERYSTDLSLILSHIYGMCVYTNITEVYTEKPVISKTYIYHTKEVGSVSPLPPLTNKEICYSFKYISIIESKEYGSCDQILTLL